MACGLWLVACGLWLVACGLWLVGCVMDRDWRLAPAPTLRRHQLDGGGDEDG